MQLRQELQARLHTIGEEAQAYVEKSRQECRRYEQQCQQLLENGKEEHRLNYGKAVATYEHQLQEHFLQRQEWNVHGIETVLEQQVAQHISDLQKNEADALHQAQLQILAHVTENLSHEHQDEIQTVRTNMGKQYTLEHHEQAQTFKYSELTMQRHMEERIHQEISMAQANRQQYEVRYTQDNEQWQQAHYQQNQLIESLMETIQQKESLNLSMECAMELSQEKCKTMQTWFNARYEACLQD